MLLRPAGRRGLSRVGDAVRKRSLSWWYLLRGVSGTFFVLSQSITAAALGVALFTVALVAGQTVTGLVMDRFGVGSSGRHPLNLTRIISALTVLLAVVWAVSGQILEDVPLWLLWMPIVAGIGQGWQQAVNGRVQVIARNTLTAIFINFVTAIRRARGAPALLDHTSRGLTGQRAVDRGSTYAKLVGDRLGTVTFQTKQVRELDLRR